MGSYPTEYLKQVVVLADSGAWAAGDPLVLISPSLTNVKVRWEDDLVEAVDINDEYVLCVARVIINEPVSATHADRFIIWKDGAPYRVVQHRVYPDIDGNEAYRQLLVGPYTA
jgi:hypothetical protein